MDVGSTALCILVSGGKDMVLLQVDVSGEVSGVYLSIHLCTPVVVGRLLSVIRKRCAHCAIKAGVEVTSRFLSPYADMSAPSKFIDTLYDHGSRYRSVRFFCVFMGQG